MGLFDSVMVSCPNCGQKVEFQSKAGDCCMDTYSVADAPVNVLCDVMNAPHYCESCGQWLALCDPEYPPGRPPRPKPSTVKVRTPENPTTHPQGMKWWAGPFSFDDIRE